MARFLRSTDHARLLVLVAHILDSFTLLTEILQRGLMPSWQIKFIHENNTVNGTSYEPLHLFLVKTSTH